MFVSEYWRQFEPVGYFWHLFTAVSYLVISILALLTNSMVLYYLIKYFDIVFFFVSFQTIVYFDFFSRVKKNNRRQEGCYFLINLAITDIFKSIFCLPMVFVSSFYGKWVFGQIGRLTTKYT
jgi:hypothetical protein